MVKRRKSQFGLLFLCASLFTVAGMLISLRGKEFAHAAEVSDGERQAFAGSVKMQVEVSNPVTPTLTIAVRDLPPAGPEDFQYRELNPRVRHDFKPAPDIRSEGGLDPLLAVQAAAPAPSDRSFDTPIFNFDGAPYQNLNPPDTNGDVGANHYIQMVNATFVSIYDKATAALITSFDLTDLGGCTTGGGDPIVLYDQAADRWLLSEFGSGNSLCVLISQTADPTGAYYSYQFSTPGFPDYPKYAVWPDAYYVTTNESSPAQYALDRNQMLAGLAATSQRFTAPDLAGFPFQALTPGDLDGATPPPAGAPNYLMRHRDDEAHNAGTNDPAHDFLEVWAFHVDFATPANSTFTQVANIQVTEFDSDLCGLSSFFCFPQPGTSTQLDPLREVIMWRLVYRNFGSHETLLGNLVTDVNGSDRGGIRWFELRKSGANPWTLYQEGTYSPDAVNRWMGAIAMDGAGNIALGYNVTDATSTYPGLRYAGRLVNDLPGSLPQGEYVLVSGTAANGSNRYGDYSSMSVDPVDDCTFWFTGEYNTASTWSTRIGAFKFDACPALPEIAVTPPNLSGAQPADVQATHPLTITNPGLAPLSWDITEALAPTCLAPTDLPWASVDPITGTTGAGLSTALAVTFDSTGLSTGVYTGTLCVASNAYTNPLVPVPLTLTVATYGVALSPAQAQTGQVGTTVTYTVQITNTGTAADIFDLAPSGQAWATTLSQSAIALDPVQSGSFTVQVAVPAGAANNDSDTATITATSRGDPTASAATTVTTTATGQEYLLYLPIIPRLQ